MSNEPTPITGLKPNETSALVDGLMQLGKAYSKQVPEVTLSNGIVLQGVSVPRVIMARMVSRFPLPKPPEQTVVINGQEHQEENPDDPEYLEALDRAHSKRIELANDVFLTMGTKLISVPEDMLRPDDDKWLEPLIMLEAIGRDEPAGWVESERYLHWLKMYALQERDDASLAWGAALAATGTLETEVIEAVEYFRTKQERTAAQIASRLEGSEAGDGDQSEPAPDGAGAGDGGEGGGAAGRDSLDPVADPAP